MNDRDIVNAQRVAIIQAIDAAWDKHAQLLVVSVPTGCDSLRQVKGVEVMGRLGFNLAVQEIVGVIVGENASNKGPAL